MNPQQDIRLSIEQCDVDMLKSLMKALENPQSLSADTCLAYAAQIKHTLAFAEPIRP